MDDNVVRLCVNGRKIEPGMNAQLYTLRDATRLPTGGWTKFLRSTPVEGACKNLIKDRMERSGMRWTEKMAEVIVKLRAVYLRRLRYLLGIPHRTGPAPLIPRLDCGSKVATPQENPNFGYCSRPLFPL